MEITILYDNTVWQEGLKASWGFSCLVEVEKHTILFDTGGNGALLLSNMKKLGVNPRNIEAVFISHAHGDHTGGLSEFLKLYPIRVYIPISCPEPRRAKEIIKIMYPTELFDNIFSTGELKNIEQSLLVRMRTGLVLIVGCSHPGVKNILDVASRFDKVIALIGGLHGFSNFDLIKDLQCICPAHCTRYKSKIQEIYPTKFISGGVGKIIEID